MENLDTLMGKYGEEGDKLIFKILNNGLDNPEKETQVREDFEKVLQGKNNKGITERALKYDLTIPFARYVAMNHAQLVFPFKRYQVQPVWRADRPQKGRYREFYQCDADVVGSQSLLNEVELASIYHEVFTKLGLTGYELRINSRKVLAALAETCGGMDKMTDITVSIDKLDKIGIDKVKAELTSRGLSDDQISIIEKYLNISGTNEEILSSLTILIGESEDGKKGISELGYLNSSLATHSAQLKIDPTLARGLNYYTGIIFEAKAPATVKMGSIGGGGRYDDLTGLFGVPNIPGVGISFGVDRLYDVLEELQLFPADVHVGTQVLFFNLGEAESKKAFELLQQLRQKGIRGELFHEQAKFDKQFKYAEKKNIPYIVVLGENELATASCNLKELATGKQQTISFTDLLTYKF
jgi:histidyl-tRNA synthetase